MKRASILACLVGSTWGQVPRLCIEDSSSIFSVTGSYTYYDTSNSMSIYNQNTTGEAYIFYFEDSLGDTYEAWGLYQCNAASYYVNGADETTDKSPATKDGCSSDPILFCPALSDDDANSIKYDGLGASDGTLDYDASAFPHFYNCTNWFAYENDANYPETETLSWTLGAHCEPTVTAVEDNVVGPGQKTDNGEDNESQTRMSSGAKAVLWTILSVFIVACIAAACYFAYHWRQKHQTELRASMAEDSGPAVTDPQTTGMGPTGLQPVKSTSVAADDDGNTLETGV